MEKHIVFILTRYLGGGQEQCFNKTAYALLQNNSDIYVYLYVIDQFTKREQLPAGIIVIETWKKLITLTKRYRECVCVNYSSDWKSSLISALVSKKYISWIHGNPLTMATARTRKINFHLIRNSYRVVCVCHEQMELLYSIYGFDKSKLLTIYNCVDLETIDIKSKEPLELNYKYILMVARFDFASKDYPTLLKAYASLDENLRNEYRLVLLGEGPDKGAVKSIVEKLELDKYVIMPGYDLNPFRWMANASLAVLISKTEGFGLTVVEAMACRTPVLITNYHTGAEEVSGQGKNCLIVDIGDVKGLASMMSKMLSDTELSSRLAENAASYVKKFDYKCFAERINIFFESLW